MFSKLTRLTTLRPLVCSQLNRKRTFFTFIDTASTGIKTTFGKAGGVISNQTMLKPGFRVYLPFIQNIYKVSNRLQQSTYGMSVKTKDNVFCNIDINVQWKIKHDNTETAYFSLDDPDNQIKSYVENVIRSTAPDYNLDDLFVQQGDISHKINETLVAKLEEHGYSIVDTQITAIEPDRGVVNSMNKINESLRLREAAKNEAETLYIKSIRAAEARAESKRLQGEGISNMRKAIMNGYDESITGFTEKHSLDPSEILCFLKDIQKLETLDAIGTSDSNNRVIFTSLDQSSTPNSTRLRNTTMKAREAKGTVNVAGKVSDNMIVRESRESRESREAREYNCMTAQAARDL